MSGSTKAKVQDFSRAPKHMRRAIQAIDNVLSANELVDRYYIKLHNNYVYVRFDEGINFGRISRKCEDFGVDIEVRCIESDSSGDYDTKVQFVVSKS